MSERERVLSAIFASQTTGSKNETIVKRILPDKI